ncbi:MAG: pterin-4-alpha-carbinolamine dehydratase [Gammaproteobacteria bacterium]|jgi:pterin-4a-carbinolamine dehydratase|nr:pterin-4-alpha-carbinolamine dehydratase [Gammaproteobacteria bacterium]
MTETGGHPWRERARPLRLERRVEFDEYDALREFLDQVAALSEETGLYPNLSFGRTYVNLTLFADEDGETLGREREDFAQRVDDLLAGPAA